MLYRWAALLLAVLARPSGAAVQVMSLRGSVEWRSSETLAWAPARPMELLEVGDAVRTGASGTARLTMGGGSWVELSARSGMTVMIEDGQLLFKLTRGTAKVRVQAAQLGAFALDTAEARLLPVLPGRFVVEAGGELTRLAVLTGRVKAAAGTSSASLVEAGRSLVLGSAAPAAEAALAPAPPRTRASSREAPATRSIPELLDALERDPRDAATLAVLSGQVKRVASQSESITPRQRSKIVLESYGRLAAQVEDDASRTLFVEGQKAFDRGELFLAADRFLLCRLLTPAEPWLRAALDDYLDELIPRRVGALKAQALDRIYEGLRAFQWEETAAALSQCEHWERRCGGLEVGALAGRVKRRGDAALSARPEGEMSEALRAVDAAEPWAIERLETLLFARHGDSSLSWWQRGGEGLRRAYFNEEIQRLTAEAQRSFASGDMEGAMADIVKVLRRSPKNRDAFALLDEMQRSRAAKPAKRGLEVAARAPAKIERQKPRAVETPAPPVAPAPSFRDQAQSEAYYQRGLAAYIQGDHEHAEAEWRLSLKANPGNAEAARAVARLARERGDRGDSLR